MAIVKCGECGGQVSDKAPACPACGAPRLRPAAVARKAASGIWTGIKLLIGLMVGVAVYQCTTALTTEQGSQAKVAHTGAVTGCQSDLAERKAKYAAFMSEERYHRAIEALGDCPRLSPSPEMTGLLHDAQRKMYLEAALDKARPIEDRETAMSLLARDFPVDAKPHEKLHQQLIKQRAKEYEQRQAQERAKRRSEGVSIGMTQEEVLQSSWGKPRKVNRTTNKYGVREQWVYDGGYLYFRDGVLTSIQN